MPAAVPRSLFLPAPLVPSDARALIERLAARVACGVDEIAVFESQTAALGALSNRLFAGQRVAIAEDASEAITAAARRAARLTTEVPVRPLVALVEGAREADLLLVSSPIQGGSAASILPRELTLLRSRAPRPLIVLDLLREDRARTPLTQPALLLPATIIVRGFGELWSACGAGCLSELVFVAGASQLIHQLGAPPLPKGFAESACADLDREDLERCVRHSTAMLHSSEC